MIEVKPAPFEPKPKPRERFQFSLRALMILTTVVALLLGLGVIVPGILGVLFIALALVFLVPTAVAIPITLVFYSKFRPFCIGLLAGFVAVWAVSDAIRLNGVFFLVFSVLGSIVGGFVALRTLQFLREMGWDQPE